MNHSTFKILPFLASLQLYGFALSLAASEVARVGDAVVSSEALRETVAQHGYNIFEERSVRKGLDDAVQFELLAAEAKRLGLDSKPAVARQIKELLVQKLLDEKVDGPLAGLRFSDEELKTYYSTRTNEFRKAALARGNVLTILVTPGKEKEARTKAAQALEQWKATHLPETVVKKYSDDPSERVNGGLTSYFVEGQPSRRYPPEIETAMLSLNLRDDITGPISTPRALYIVGLIERRDAQLIPFEQAKAEIHKRLIRERRQKALFDYCECLKRDFHVTVNETALKEVVKASKPGDAPPNVPGGTP